MTANQNLTPQTLILDVGNTNIKWGILRNQEWLSKGQMPTSQWDELKSLLQQYPAITHIRGTSVAGLEVNAGLEAASAPLAIHWVKSGEPRGVIESTYDMSQLGPDRWAGLLGAYSIAPDASQIVIQAGTATTVDALIQNRHLGGLILPGITMMKNALRQGTAKLVYTDGALTPFPLNTPDAITTGTLMATLGAIQQMAKQLKQEGHPNPSCILSGGSAEMIRPHLELPALIEDNLVLEGLRASL